MLRTRLARSYYAVRACTPTGAEQLFKNRWVVIDMGAISTFHLGEGATFFFFFRIPKTMKRFGGGAIIVDITNMGIANRYDARVTAFSYA